MAKPAARIDFPKPRARVQKKDLAESIDSDPGAGMRVD